MSSVQPAGSCKHRPISNGWSPRYSRDGQRLPGTSVWCGHCRASIELDDEWRAKFAARGKAVA